MYVMNNKKDRCCCSSFLKQTLSFSTDLLKLNFFNAFKSMKQSQLAETQSSWKTFLFTSQDFLVICLKRCPHFYTSCTSQPLKQSYKGLYGSSQSLLNGLLDPTEAHRQKIKQDRELSPGEHHNRK